MDFSSELAAAADAGTREGTDGVIGNLLGGRYELRGKLAHGGVGEVYEAWDAILGRRVAVRLLDERKVGDPLLVARFLREGQASAWLTHPNVVAIHDGGRDGDVHFIVTEHVDGRTLAELLRDGPLAPERAAAIASDVCLALDHAHRHGVVHRDLSPRSILVNAGGEVKVTDFRGTEPAGPPGAKGGAEVAGTPEYLAPEQAAGGAIDGRTDLYALGCCLYEMLTGTPPFGRVGDADGAEALTPIAIALAHLRSPPAPPHRRRPDVPAALDRVVMRALAKQPDARQQGAEELRRDLERFSRRPVPAPVVVPPPQPARQEPGAARRPAAGGMPRGRAAPPAAPPGAQPVGGPPPPAWGSGGSPPAPAAGPAMRPGAPLPVPRETAPLAAREVVAARAARNGSGFQRRLAAIIGLAAVAVLAAGGTIAALSPDDPADTRGTAAAVAPPSTEVPSTEFSPTTEDSTTTSTPSTTSPTTTSRAPTTTGNPLATVPRVVGWEVGDAVAELSRRKLRARVESVSTRRRSQLGEVVRQEPRGGARIPQGTTVTLVVAISLDRGGEG